VVLIVPEIRPDPLVRLPAEHTTSPVSLTKEKLPAMVVSNVAGAAVFDEETLTAVSVNSYESAAYTDVPAADPTVIAVASIVVNSLLAWVTSMMPSKFTSEANAN